MNALAAKQAIVGTLAGFARQPLTAAGQ